MSLRFRALFLTAFGLVTLSIACAAESGEEADESGDALSDGVCQPRAQKAKDEAYNKCANGSFDYTACMKPARDALAQATAAYNAAIEAAKQRGDAASAGWDKVASDCIALLPADCAELLKADAYEAAKFKNGKGDQTVCNQERAARRAECNSKAMADETAENFAAIRAADAAWLLKWQARNRAGLSCGSQKAVDATYDALACSFPANFAYDNAYGTCRRQCPAETNAACTPKAYADQKLRVDCGAMKKKKSAWNGNCEDNLECKRTDVCEKYDDAIDAAKDQPACADGKTRIFKIVMEKRGDFQIAKQVVTDCIAPDRDGGSF